MKKGEEDSTEFEMKGFLKGFSGGAVVMNSPGNAGDTREARLIPWVRKIPWRWKYQPTLVVLPGQCHGCLVGYSPWGCKEPNMT